MAATAARGEVTEPAIIKEVLISLCRGPKAATRSTIDSHFADSILLKSALFSVSGRERLFQLFRAWQAAFDDHLQVLDVAVHGNRALARIRHNLQPRILNAQFPVVGVLPDWIKRSVAVPFIVAAEFTFEDTPRGMRIVRWVEDISIYSLLYSIPFAERLWSAAVEPAGGLLLSNAGALFDYVAPHADKALAEATGWKTGLAQI